MSPNFPPLGVAPFRAVNSGSGRPIALRPGTAGPRLIPARVILTVAGVAGFLGLLVAAVHAGAPQQVLRISAFVWFFGFGAARIIVDLRASRASTRERDRRVGGGLL